MGYSNTIGRDQIYHIRPSGFNWYDYPRTYLIASLIKYRFILFFQTTLISGQDNLSSNHAVFCRSQAGTYRTVQKFQLTSYAWCFHFIFYIKYRSIVNATGSTPSVLFIQDGRIRIIPSLDYTNRSARGNVCSYLSQDECHQWTSCCSAADDCCQRQLALPPEVNNTCGRIWDGWSCWDDVAPGTKNYVPCPLFMPFFSQSSKNELKSNVFFSIWAMNTFLLEKLQTTIVNLSLILFFIYLFDAIFGI